MIWFFFHWILPTGIPASVGYFVGKKDKEHR